MKTLLVIIGPTAVGKTELSIQLAKLLSCDIISADSRQIYRDITIGTAKPTEAERQQVPHHFIDTLPLDAYYSAAQYEADVLQLLEHQFQDHDVALLTGGSMMYIDAVTKGIDDIPTIADETRTLLKERLDNEGLDQLLAELRLLDPEYYDIVDKKNHKRIVHALEICYQTGQPYSNFRRSTQKQRPFRIIKIGLNRQRETLFDRINRRVDQMMRDGMLDEARRVLPKRHLNALNTVGYKELFNALDGTWELPMAIERIKKNTRVYAKKQLTWFKRDTDIHWINLDTTPPDAALQEILSLL